MHTKVVLARGQADGVVGSVTDHRAAATEVARTRSVGHRLAPMLVFGRTWVVRRRRWSGGVRCLESRRRCRCRGASWRLRRWLRSTNRRPGGRAPCARWRRSPRRSVRKLWQRRYRTAAGRRWPRLVVGDLDVMLARWHWPHVGARGELRHGKGADGGFHWELLGVDVIQIVHPRGVNEPSRRTRASATRRDLLTGGPIEICSEPVEGHGRSAPERGDGRVGAYESMPAQRRKLADRDSVSGHDK